MDLSRVTGGMQHLILSKSYGVIFSLSNELRTSSSWVSDAALRALHLVSQKKQFTLDTDCLSL